MIRIGDFATVRKARWYKITPRQRGRIGVVVALDMTSKRATILTRTVTGKGKGTMRISAPIDAFDLVERPEVRMNLIDSLYHARELEE